MTAELDRAEKLAGLRELVEWLEANPALPLPSINGSVFPEGQYDDDKDLAKALTELYRLAGVMGVEPSVPHVRHVRADGPTFRGGLHYQVIVCDAAEDFARGVGRVAGPVVGAGPATAPTEPEPVPAERARVRNALRVMAYAVEQGWVVVRPTMVEVLAAELEPIEQRWLLAGLAPFQIVEGDLPDRITVEGTVIGRLVRVHLPDTADSLRLIRRALNAHAKAGA